MVESGILGPDDKVELLEGYVVFKMARNPPHDSAIQRILRTLYRLIPPEWDVRIQMAVELSDSKPESDFAIVRGDYATYKTRHPGPPDIGLLVEVANTSLDRDIEEKVRIYARSNIVAYWVIDVTNGVVHVFTGPSGPTATPAYADHVEIGPGGECTAHARRHRNRSDPRGGLAAVTAIEKRKAAKMSSPPALTPPLQSATVHETDPAPGVAREHRRRTTTAPSSRHRGRAWAEERHRPIRHPAGQPFPGLVGLAVAAPAVAGSPARAGRAPPEKELDKLSDDEIKQYAARLRGRARGGTSLEKLLPEAFGLVCVAAKRTLGLRPFDVQLAAGGVMHFVGLAELATGEGKTLTAALPAVLNALTGKGVHVTTVNDYLAKRDAEWIGPIYQAARLVDRRPTNADAGLAAEDRLSN